MAPAEDNNVMVAKARGNDLFRDGDFSGAAEAFQGAVEDIRQMSSPKSDAEREVELACLCNLAFARIKLGSMHEAEEACSQALHIKSSCAKALFRRGQARLALGRAIEAASDFQAMSVLEPNNVEAFNMLHRAEEKATDQRIRAVVTVKGVHQPPRRGGHEESGGSELELLTTASLSRTTVEVKDITNGESRNRLGEIDTPTRPTPSVVISTTSRGSEASPPPETSNSGSKRENARAEHVEARGDAEQNRVEASFIPSPTSVSSFLVSGWLTSAEREQGKQQQKIDKHKCVDIHHPQSEATMNYDRSEVDTPGRAKQSTVSVSRLVSQLSASRKAAFDAKESPGASGTTTAAAQAEWSSLQAEEKKKVEESVRRWSSVVGLHSQDTSTETATATTAEKGKAFHIKRGRVRRKKDSESAPAANKHANRGEEPEKKVQTSAWWASLEEEESKVREAFRAKLGIKEKPSTKKKEKEKIRKTQRC